MLSWNLFHGRDHAPDRSLHTWRSRLLGGTVRGVDHVQVNRDLCEQFAGVLADSEWDIALLQECPPRWAEELANRTRSEPHLVLTARNLWPPLDRPQRLVARANPDLIASWEGGSNLTLVRTASASTQVVSERRELLLTRRPERRRMAFTRLRPGLCVANLHGSEAATASAAELERAAEAADSWSRGSPLILGGDFNLRPAANPPPFASLQSRYGLSGASASDRVDHILGRGLERVAATRSWPPGAREVPEPDPPKGARPLPVRLSDHAPIEADFTFDPAD